VRGKSWHAEAARLFLEGPRVTLQNLAERFHVSRERVRQVLERALGDTRGLERRHERAQRRRAEPPEPGSIGRLIWDIAHDLGLPIERAGRSAGSLLRINGYLCRIRAGSNIAYRRGRGYTHFHVGRRDAEFQILVQDAEQTRRVLIVPDAALRPDVWVPVARYARAPAHVDWLQYAQAWDLLGAGRKVKRTAAGNAG
jgi:hypothetical protein